MAAKPTLSTRQAGQDWLLTCTTQPSDVCRRWADEELAPIRSGVHWRIAQAPLLQSVRAMRRIGWQRLGPVLADPEVDLGWWLLPPSVGDELDSIRIITVHPADWVLDCPPVLHAVEGRTWLERPDGSGQLTDPLLLAAALGHGDARLPMEASR
ncbi:hypothetical protein [Streptomyces sp. NPDC000878]